MSQTSNTRWPIVVAAILGALAAPACARPTSILTDTIADLTYVELETAAKQGAVALWALGAIEEHGPHLPLATDVYIPSEQLRLVREKLSRDGISSVIVPPYYWGVNRVTGSFPGSIDIRPEVMIELMSDVFRSLTKAGVQEVYCITGHYDAAHGQAIVEAVRRANRDGTITAHFVVPSTLGRRLGLAADESGFLLVDPSADEPPPFPDLHAGDAETSAMLHAAPETVRTAIVPTLKGTDLSAEEVALWRQGYEEARRITPQGYLGVPAGAAASRGAARLAADADAYADAIAKAVKARANGPNGAR